MTPFDELMARDPDAPGSSFRRTRRADRTRGTARRAVLPGVAVTIPRTRGTRGRSPWRATVATRASGALIILVGTRVGRHGAARLLA